MNLFIMRHGESMQNAGLNKERQFIDSNVPLTQKGKEQAYDAGMIFEKYIQYNRIDLYGGENGVTALYSPYKRTKQTAEYFQKGITLLHTLRLKENILLTEQQWGLFDSVPEEQWDSICKPAADLYHKTREQKGKFWAKPYEGEAPFDVYNRVGKLVDEINNYKGGTLILFTHGTTARCIIMRLLDETVEWYERTHNPKNASIWFLEKDINGKWNDKGYINQ